VKNNFLGIRHRGAGQEKVELPQEQIR